MSAKGTTANTKEKHGGGKLSDKIDPVLDEKAQEELVTARVGLLIRHPFFGKMATRLKLINADSWLPTAATDGRRFYYNSDFVTKKTPDENAFLFGHEVLHVVLDHMGRCGDRDPRLWNCACDYAVNAILVEQKIGKMIQPCLYETKYHNMTAEEIYDDLYENVEKIDINDLLDKIIDDHMEEGEGDDGDGEEGKDGDKKGKRPTLSDEEREEIRKEIKEAILQSAHGEKAGNLPGEIKRMIKDLTQPVINWKDLIQQQIQSVVKEDYSFMRPNRKGWGIDAILPGMTPGTEIDVHIALDMSGSITDEDGKAFLSEVKGMMEAYENYTIHIWCFDTAIYNYQKFSSQNGDDIMDYEPQGGGGTDFEVNWKFMKDEGIEPKKFIMFTDGYCYGDWGDPNYCDTVWIFKGNKNAEPPFGVWAIYENEMAKA